MYPEAVTLYPRTGGSLRGDPVAAPPQTIYVRSELHRREVLNGKGETVLSDTRIFTEYPLQPGDTLLIGERRRPVVSASAMKDLNGTVDHYEARL